MRVLAFFNMKGGVGKTTAAVNTAFLAAREGRGTLLWDLDPQGSATWYFRLPADLDAKTRRFVKGKVKLAKLTVPSGYANLDILPADFSLRDLDVILGDVKRSTKRLAELLGQLTPRYDLVVLDCPPSMSLLSENVFRAADVLAIPVLPSPLSWQTYEQVVAFLEDSGRGDDLTLAPFYSLVDMRKKLHRETVADIRAPFCESWIPGRSLVEQMAVRRAPLPVYSPRSQTTAAYEALWTELHERLSLP